jgi:hypothetical protein
MNVPASIAMGTDIIDQTLFITGMTLAAFGIIICISLFIYDLRRFYRERSQGIQSVWYKRPTILFGEALFLFSLTNMINELRLGKVISATPLFYVFLFTLPVIGITILVYSFVINGRKRRV